MNKIYDLATQAGLITFESIHDSMAVTPSIESVAKARKFAELIIKEYEKLLPEVCPWAESDQEGPMKGWHVQFVARKHFGVKE
jgi:hypothetical protein